MKLSRVAQFVVSRKRGVTTADVAERFCISRTLATTYLRELRDLGVVEVRGRDGRNYIYFGRRA